MNYSFPCLVFEPTHLKTRTTIVLLHGGSSHHESLRTLAPYFGDFRLLIPQAPIENENGSFDWFRFVDEQLNVQKDSLKMSMESISSFVNEIREETEGNLVIAGISQGAIFAGELFFRSEVQFDGLMLLSGFLLSDVNRSYSGQSAFVAHGSSDPLVPVERAS